MKFTKIFLFSLLAIFSLSFITNVAQAGSAIGQVTVTVIQTVTPPPVPTASLTADSYLLPYGGNTILHISGTNASYCILSWPGGSDKRGLKWDYTTPALTTTTTYTLACGNTKADEAVDSQIITVSPKPKTYTVSTQASPVNGGTISPTSAIVDESKTTSFTILANAGYTLASVTGTGTGCNLVTSSGNNQYTTGAVFSDCTVTANFVIVSVTANPLTYTVNPGTTVKFIYTATTNSGRGTECRLLDNVQAPLTIYQASGPIPFYINYPVGSYGFYVQCRDTKTITATANSAKITVNVIKDPICPNPNGCPWGTDLCPNTPGVQTTLPCPPPIVGMSGVLNASDCTIQVNQSSCSVPFSWNVTNPENVGGSAITKTGSPLPIATGDTGNSSITLSYNGSTTLYLYNNTKELARKFVKAIVDTKICTWNGSICEKPPVGPKRDGVWSVWAPSISDACGASGSSTRNCNNPAPANGGLECLKSDNVTRALIETISYNNDPTLCPQINIDSTYKGGATGGTPIPYNGKIEISCSGNNVDLTGCTCTYKDSIGEGVCVGFNQCKKYTTPALKRTTSYTITCPGKAYGTATGTKQVLVGDINANYIEQ